MKEEQEEIKRVVATSKLIILTDLNMNLVVKSSLCEKYAICIVCCTIFVTISRNHLFASVSMKNPSEQGAICIKNARDTSSQVHFSAL